jgi:hypothetical protein
MVLRRVQFELATRVTRVRGSGAFRLQEDGGEGRHIKEQC